MEAVNVIEAEKGAKMGGRNSAQFSVSASESRQYFLRAVTLRKKAPVADAGTVDEFAGGRGASGTSDHGTRMGNR